MIMSANVCTVLSLLLCLLGGGIAALFSAGRISAASPGVLLGAIGLLFLHLNSGRDRSEARRSLRRAALTVAGLLLLFLAGWRCGLAGLGFWALAWMEERTFMWRASTKEAAAVGFEGLKGPFVLMLGWFAAGAEAGLPPILALAAWSAWTVLSAGMRIARRRAGFPSVGSPGTARRSNVLNGVLWLCAAIWLGSLFVLGMNYRDGLFEGTSVGGASVFWHGRELHVAAGLLPVEKQAQAEGLRQRVLSNPQDVVALVQLGELYKLSGFSAAARPLLERAVGLEPRQDHARYMLGEIYAGLGLYGAAIRHFCAVIENSPKHTPPMLSIARLLLMTGHERSAYRMIRQADAVEPGIPATLQGLARLSTRLGESYDVRHAYWTRYLAVAPTDPEAVAAVKALDAAGPPRDLSRMRRQWPKVASPVVVWAGLGAIVWLASRHSRRAARFREDGLLFLGLYAVSLTALLFAHYLKVSADPGLNGEELDCTFRNVAYFGHRVQADEYSAGFSGVLFFWLGSHVVPMGVHYGRLWKIFFMAALPVVAAGLVREGGCRGRGGPMLAGLILAFSGPVAWLSIMGTDYCLDAVSSLAMLIVAWRIPWDGRPGLIARRLVALVALAVWTVHSYASSLVVFPVMAGALLYRVYTTPGLTRAARHARSGWLVGAGAATCVLAGWPFLWYASRPLATFMGCEQASLSAGAVPANARTLLGDLFIEPQSYLLSLSVPVAVFPLTVGGVGVLMLAVIGIRGMFRERRAWAVVLCTVGVLSLAMALLAGENGGLRRCIPFAVVMAAFAGVGAERLLSGGMPLLVRRVVLAAILCSAMSSYVGGYLRMHSGFKQWLQKDFRFSPGLDYAQTVEAIVRDAAGHQLSFTEKDYDPATFFMLSTLADRRGETYIPPEYAGAWDPRIPRRPYVAPATPP